LGRWQVAGGLEIHISEGYTPVDVVTVDDDETKNVIGPLPALIGPTLL